MWGEVRSKYSGNQKNRPRDIVEFANLMVTSPLVLNQAYCSGGEFSTIKWIVQISAMNLKWSFLGKFFTQAFRQSLRHFLTSFRAHQYIAQGLVLVAWRIDDRNLLQVL